MTAEERVRERAYQAAWAKANPEKVREYSRNQLRGKKGRLLRMKRKTGPKPMPISEAMVEEMVLSGSTTTQIAAAVGCSPDTIERRFGHVLSIKELGKIRIDRDFWTHWMTAQSGRCAVCEEPLRGDRSTHIDHCHETGAIRGILCHACNLALGFLRDDAHRAIKAAKYLLRGAV